MIIDGRKIAKKILSELKIKIEKLPRVPKLTVVLVGDNPSSLSYIRQKRKYALEVGIDFEVLWLPIDTSEKELIATIEKLNNDPSVNGFIIQLPLPSHIQANSVIEAIDPKKDVDGFTSENIGKLFLDNGQLISCTPKGVMRIFEEIWADLLGKNVVMIGKSNIVGKPLSLLLMNAGATVSVCHKDTKNITYFTKNADIVIVAAGYPGLIQKDMIPSGCIVIDVGFSVVDGRIYGDANFPEIEPYCSITPVPGWVWPMTVTMLIENTYVAAKNQM